MLARLNHNSVANVVYTLFFLFLFLQPLWVYEKCNNPPQPGQRQYFYFIYFFNDFCPVNSLYF